VLACGDDAGASGVLTGFVRARAGFELLTKSDSACRDCHKLARAQHRVDLSRRA